MGYIASNYEKSNYRVVLSKQAYVRLLGLINLCGLNINGEYDEFGSLIYGKVESGGVIYLDIPSNVDDNKVQSKAFSMSNSMWKELESKIENNGCRLFAHFHTHPYFQDDRNRLYSESDILFYQALAIELNKKRKAGDKVMVLGCMASVSGINISSLDDLSIVYYDIEQNKMIYIPAVYVRINGKEYELKNIQDEYLYNGTSFPINRTLLDVDTEKEQKHR